MASITDKESEPEAFKTRNILSLIVSDPIFERVSIDEEHGDASTMIRWPKGWKRLEPEYLDCDEEFLVLEGSIEINNNIYKKHDYAHLPKGYLRNTQSSKTGAVTISFFSSEPS